ncbi:hypothetical protein B0H14DRAFT_2712533 [Mycena olivaceomarginata]|nr:hypothetical protein B0H14DRAFT_2712533 [Mycena olivaceomarginata]
MLLLLRRLSFSAFGFDGSCSYTIQFQVLPFPSCKPGTAGLSEMSISDSSSDPHNLLSIHGTMPPQSSILVNLARSKLKVSSRRNHLHRWVLLKNLIVHSGNSDCAERQELMSLDAGESSESPRRPMRDALESAWIEALLAALEKDDGVNSSLS